nr:hypothetical protein [Tanacetum cinerariifolium]
KHRFHAQISSASLHYSPPQEEHHHKGRSDLMGERQKHPIAAEHCLSWSDIIDIADLVKNLGWLEMGAHAKYVMTCNS